MYSVNRKSFIKFSIIYISSYILLIVIFSIYTVLSLPDFKKWKKKNPELQDIAKYKIDSAKKPQAKNRIFYRYCSAKQIPDLYLKTIVISEDASFWVHQGIDWFEVKESIFKNFTQGRLVRGGSTITQQVVKNLYLSPEKTFSRKFKEWIIAWQLDRQLRKTRILEIYVNIIEWGNNIYGIRAASLKYFKKNPDKLELHEMVRLAAVLPNPLRMTPNQVNKAVYWRSNVILDRLLKYNFIEQLEYNRTKSKLDSLSLNI
jgi:membrane peptidoglycan carboxypeptidase